jgi:hypothetical protein
LPITRATVIQGQKAHCRTHLGNNGVNEREI